MQTKVWETNPKETLMSFGHFYENWLKDPELPSVLSVRISYESRRQFPKNAP